MQKMIRFDFKENNLLVRKIALRQKSEILSKYRILLSEDELKRADQFVFPEDRQKYIAARGILRETLGAFLKTEPSSLIFEYGKAGKPKLKNVPIQFNLSHSHNMGLIAIHPDCEIGIDLEWRRDLKDMDGLAKTVFSAAELSAYLACPAAEKVKFFYELWTLKEAFIKGTGEGFTRDPQTISLPVALLKKKGVCSPVVDHRIADRWRLRQLSILPDYEAAIAIKLPQR